MGKYESYKTTFIPWLRDIPEHWSECRAKYLYKKENRAALESDEVITCFRDGQVTLRKNRRTSGFTESIKEIGYQHIQQGDLVIHVMDAFAGAVGVSDSDGKGTPVYSVCTAIQDINNYYFAYAIREMAKKGFIQSLYHGIRERSSDFRFDVFAAQILPVPPREEQDQIVRYLDWQTSKINKLIAAKKKQIELLDEYERSIAYHFVTNGVSDDVLKKDSTINWMTSVPAHWKILLLSQVAEEQSISNRGMIETNLLSLSYGKIVKKDINATEGLLPANFEGYQIINKDNIILRLTDLQNDHRSLRVGISTQTGIITSAYVCLSVKNNMLPKFLYFQLHSADLCKVFYGMGGGVRQSIGYKDIRRMLIAVPPINEQQEIVDKIDKMCSELKPSINSIQTQIKHLEELKTRLISDVVTGQIDVRDIEIPDFEMMDETIDTNMEEGMMIEE